MPVQLFSPINLIKCISGTVELNERNVKVIIKFAAIYKVEELVTLCVEWLKGHISADNLNSMIELGLLIQNVGHDNQELLDLCRDYIDETVKDDFLERSRGWVFAEKSGFVKFLVQYEILNFTIPVLVEWIEQDADVKLILDLVEARGLTLSNYGSKAGELFEKMSEKMGSLETSRRIIHYSVMSKGPKYPEPSIIEYVKGLNLEKMLASKKDYELSNFEYIELMLVWIDCIKTTNIHTTGIPWKIDGLTELWQSVRQSELTLHYANSLQAIFKDQVKTVVDCPNPLDQFNLEQNVEYQCFESPLLIFSSSSAATTKLIDGSHETARPSAQTTSNPIKQILNGEKLIFPDINCKKCGMKCDLTLRFVQAQKPYFKVSSKDNHFNVQHFQIVTIDQTVPFTRKPVGLFSLMGYDTVRKWIKKRLAVGLIVAGICIYQCNGDAIKSELATSSFKRRKTGD